MRRPRRRLVAPVVSSAVRSLGLPRDTPEQREHARHMRSLNALASAAIAFHAATSLARKMPATEQNPDYRRARIAIAAELERAALRYGKAVSRG